MTDFHLIKELRAAEEKVKRLHNQTSLNSNQCIDLQQTLSNIIDLYKEAPTFPDKEGEILESEFLAVRRMLNALWEDGDCFRFSNLSDN